MKSKTTRSVRNQSTLTAAASAGSPAAILATACAFCMTSPLQAVIVLGHDLSTTPSTVYTYYDDDNYGFLRTELYLSSNPSFALDYSAPQHFQFIFTPQTPGTYTLNVFGDDGPFLSVDIIAGSGAGNFLNGSSSTFEFLDADDSVLKTLTKNGALASTPNRFSFNAQGDLTEPLSFSSMRVSFTLGTTYHGNVPVSGMDPSTQLSLTDTRIAVSSYLFFDAPATYDGPGLITFTAVPEPSTYAALTGLLALACVGLRRWRQNRNKAA